MEQVMHKLKLAVKQSTLVMLNADASCLMEMISHPKFLKMHDGANDVFVSLEDIAAFEILDYRKDENGESPPAAAQ